jgi:hypothetical protein
MAKKRALKDPHSFFRKESLLSECLLYKLGRYDLFAEGICTGLVRLYGADHFRKILAIGFLQCCNYFLCHRSVVLAVIT